MGEKLLDWLQKIVTGPRSRLFWAFVIIALIIAVIVFPYIDANYLYYNRIEKRISNLQALVEISGSTIEESEALNAEYQSILQEMESAREKALSNATNAEDSIHNRRVKFFAAAGLWYFVAVLVLFAKKKGEKLSFRKLFNNFCSMVLCFIIGSVLGWVFTMIPTLGYVEVNAVFSIIVELVVVWLLIVQPKKNPATP